MSKRSEEQDIEQSNLTDRQLLEMIWSKMEKIDNMIEKMDQFEIRMSASENKIKMLEEEHEELQRGTSFIETEFQTQRQAIDQIKTEMVSKDEFMKLQKEVIDQSNRQRRKNVVFYNVPEGTEGKDCTGYINMLVKKIEENLKIETAHRSPTYDSRKGERENPRPIHALCITRDDRDEILEKLHLISKTIWLQVRKCSSRMTSIHRPGRFISFCWKSRESFVVEDGWHIYPSECQGC